MKHYLFYAFFISVFIFASCSKTTEESNITKSFDFKDLPCKKDGTIPSQTETILFNSVDNNLEFKHVNAILNCDPGTISLSYKVVVDTIIINEFIEQNIANCVCNYDLNCIMEDIGNGSYTFLFYKHDNLVLETQLEISSSTNIEIVIK